MKRQSRLALLLALSFWCSTLAPTLAQRPWAKLAPKPLYRDPVFDGAADPVVIWNPRLKRWWMFYTNRRARVKDLTAHTGTRNSHWHLPNPATEAQPGKYLQEAVINDGTGLKDGTHWAPYVAKITPKHLGAL